jgi:hypothetical protein
MGAAIAADNDNAVSIVVPPSLTKDKDGYVGALVVFEGTCVSAFAGSAGDSAEASALLSPCCRHCAVRRCRISCCRHRR